MMRAMHNEKQMRMRNTCIRFQYAGSRNINVVEGVDNPLQGCDYLDDKFQLSHSTTSTGRGGIQRGLLLKLCNVDIVK